MCSAPSGVCVCEDLTGLEANGAGACCQATWLFRHDVIDGWRALRYLCGVRSHLSPNETSAVALLGVVVVVGCCSGTT